MLRVSLVLAALLWVVTGSSSADEPRGKPRAIEFDSKLSFPCREVTPKDFALANKDRKVVEATLRISANFTVEEKEIESIVYRIMLPRHLEIADYLPKTELASDVSGTVDTRQQVASRTSMMVSFEAGGKIGYRIPTVLEAEGQASAGGRNEKANEVSSGVQVKFLPPSSSSWPPGRRTAARRSTSSCGPSARSPWRGRRNSRSSSSSRRSGRATAPCWTARPTRRATRTSWPSSRWASGCT